MARFMNWNASAALVVLSSSSSPSSIRLSVVRQWSIACWAACLKVASPSAGSAIRLLFPVDPVPVGVDQRLELRAVLLRVGLGQLLHVEDQARPAWRRPG